MKGAACPLRSYAESVEGTWALCESQGYFASKVSINALSSFGESKVHKGFLNLTSGAFVDCGYCM